MDIRAILKNKEKYSVEDLLRVIEVLRSPSGCPWDMEQTHSSLRRDYLEECYEALEAIDLEDADMLREELGDVLFHIIFHSRIEEERGNFTFYDVVSDVAAKMISRHPHVFSGLGVDGMDEILSNWDAIKKEAKGQKTKQEVLRAVTPAMPALMRCQKVAKKAEKNGVLPKVDPASAITELLRRPELGQTEIGEIISLAVYMAEKAGVDAEMVLSENTRRFIDGVKE